MDLYRLMFLIFNSFLTITELFTHSDSMYVVKDVVRFDMSIINNHASSPNSRNAHLDKATFKDMLETSGTVNDGAKFIRKDRLLNNTDTATHLTNGLVNIDIVVPEKNRIGGKDTITLTVDATGEQNTMNDRSDGPNQKLEVTFGGNGQEEIDPSEDNVVESTGGAVETNDDKENTDELSNDNDEDDESSACEDGIGGRRVTIRYIVKQ